MTPLHFSMGAFCLLGVLALRREESICKRALLPTAGKYTGKLACTMLHMRSYGNGTPI